MRITRFVTLPLLAALSLTAAVAVACSNADATSPDGSRHARGNRTKGRTSAGIAIPAPNGFTSQALARGSFLDAIDAKFKIKGHGGTTVVHVDDPTQMVMAKITLAVGGALPWHTHPGPALVTVATGEITIVDGESCEVHVYPAGTAFMDAGQGHVHVGFNTASVETAVYVTYLDVPVGASPLVVASSPGC
jgi:quercetin dioxygenase-like cupin family protein